MPRTSSAPSSGIWNWFAIPWPRSPDCPTAKRDVLEALGEIYRSAFDAGLKDVGARLAELKTAQQADEDERLAKAAQVKKEALAVVEKDTSKIESQRTAIQASAEQLQGAARQAVQLQRELAPLSQDRLALGVQIGLITSQIQELRNPQVIDQRRPNGTNPTRTVRPLDPTDPRFVQLQALSMQLAVLNKQAFDMDRKILIYRRQIALLNLKGEQDVQMIAERQAAAAATQRDAQVAQRAIKRSEKSASTRSVALIQKTKLLSTYVPFPYAQEKNRVLAWFAD